MPHISQRKLKKHTFIKISNQLINVIAKQNSHDTKLLLKELLTPTEKIMLAKRLALIFMIAHNYPFRKMGRELKISPSTIARFWKMEKQNSFTNILLLQKNKSGKGFWTELKKFLR